MLKWHLLSQQITIQQDIHQKGATASKKKSTRRGRGGKKAEQATTEAPKAEEQNP